MTKSADFDKYKYSGYGTEFNARGSFLLSNGSGLAKMFAAGMSSLVHINNKKKGILVLCEGSIDGLDDTELAAEKEYAIHFTGQQ